MSLNTILATTPLVSTNYILKATGTTIGNSLIWDNGTNVGIGNTNTSYTLDVSGSLRNTTSAYFATTSGVAVIGATSANAISKLSVRIDATHAIAFEAISPAGNKSIYIAPVDSGTHLISSNYLTGSPYLPLAISARENTSDLYLAINGNVGIGTSSPAAERKLTVVGGAQFTGGDNTGASFNIVPAAAGQNGADFNLSYATGTGYGPLTFTLAGAERMRITSGGVVGINQTTDPYNHRLTSNGGSAQGIMASTDTTGNDCVSMWNKATSGNNTFTSFYVGSGVTGVGYIFYNRSAGLTVFSTTSDYRLKSEISDFNALDIVLNLKPKEFKIRDAKQKAIGFIAHELKEYFPQAVIGEKDEVKEDGTPIYQSVDYSQLTGLLVKAIQEMNTKLDEQNQTIQNLQEQINILAK